VGFREGPQYARGGVTSSGNGQEGGRVREDMFLPITGEKEKKVEGPWKLRSGGGFWVAKVLFVWESWKKTLYLPLKEGRKIKNKRRLNPVGKNTSVASAFRERRRMTVEPCFKSS